MVLNCNLNPNLYPNRAHETKLHYKGLRNMHAKYVKLHAVCNKPRISHGERRRYVE